MGKILEINGPLVRLELPEAVLGEQVRVGRSAWSAKSSAATATPPWRSSTKTPAGLHPGEVAEGLGWPLSVELGPGLLNAIFDGVQRPLNAVWEQSGDRIARGVSVPSLPRDQALAFRSRSEHRSAGGHMAGGDVLGTVQETESIQHRILTPPLLHGELLELAPEGDYTIEEVIGR
jgi:V/A-type H+-transporting ATPase subunit A